MTVFIVTADPSHRERWQGFVHATGRNVSALLGISELEKAASSGVVALALVDWALVAGAPADRMTKLRQAAPGLRVLIFGEESVLFGPEAVQALSSGADDFLILSADKATLLNKLTRYLEEIGGVENLKTKSLRVNMMRREVETWARNRWRKVERLTPKEFGLLCLFLKSPGVDLPRRLIIEKVWGMDADAVNLEAVDKQVVSLRKKLGPLGRRIMTLRGIGYRFLENA